MLTQRPAQVFGITDRGTLEDGKPADVVVFDAERGRPPRQAPCLRPARRGRPHHLRRQGHRRGRRQRRGDPPGGQGSGSRRRQAARQAPAARTRLRLRPLADRSWSLRDVVVHAHPAQPPAPGRPGRRLGHRHRHPRLPAVPGERGRAHRPVLPGGGVRGGDPRVEPGDRLLRRHLPRPLRLRRHRCLHHRDPGGRPRLELLRHDAGGVRGSASASASSSASRRCASAASTSP